MLHEVGLILQAPSHQDLTSRARCWLARR